jgi:hypothetical protein
MAAKGSTGTGKGQSRGDGKGRRRSGAKGLKGGWPQRRALPQPAASGGELPQPPGTSRRPLFQLPPQSAAVAAPGPLPSASAPPSAPAPRPLARPLSQPPAPSDAAAATHPARARSRAGQRLPQQPASPLLVQPAASAPGAALCLTPTSRCPRPGPMLAQHPAESCRSCRPRPGRPAQRQHAAFCRSARRANVHPVPALVANRVGSDLAIRTPRSQGAVRSSLSIINPRGLAQPVG